MTRGVEGDQLLIICHAKLTSLSPINVTLGIPLGIYNPVQTFYVKYVIFFFLLYCVECVNKRVFLSPVRFEQPTTDDMLRSVAGHVLKCPHSHPPFCVIPVSMCCKT